MRINDKSLPEIFGDIPWQYKIVVVAGLCFVVFAILYVPYAYVTFGVRDVKPGPFRITSGAVRPLGQLDPAIAITDGASPVIAYAGIVPAEGGNAPPATGIFVATGNKGCTRWTTSGTPVFEPRAEELMGPDGMTPVTRGVWRTETPAIVHDPQDKGREWKIFAYKYFWPDEGMVSLARLYGAIVYKYTSDPMQGAWSDEEWLFSAADGTPPYPYGNLVKARLNNLHDSLRDVYFYARPSVLRVGDTLLMSLSAFVQGKDTPDRVILLASKDHGKTWHYLGTPITQADAARIAGIETFNGATLVAAGKDIYLAAVLGTAAQQANGTYLFRFADISRAQIETKNGAPALYSHLPLVATPPGRLGGGFAAFHPSCEGGIITSEMFADGRFSLVNTQQSPFGKK